MIVRRLLSRTGAAVLAVTVALATAIPAQAAPAPADSPGVQGGVEVGVVRQIANNADTRYCLTFVTSNKVPMAVMMACAPGKEGKTQEWFVTAKGQLQVAMSKSVGGDLARTGACLDTGADLVRTPANAPVLVLPCRDGEGQRWNYDQKAGSFVNAANGMALSSLLGKGMEKQAQPTGNQPANGATYQSWSLLGLPGLELLGAVLALVNAQLESLGLALPLPIAEAATDLFNLVQAENPVPAQLTTLPKQMMELARR